MVRTATGVIGFFLLAGTAGASDLDPFMPLWQITLQSLAGLAMFAWGIRKHWAANSQ